MAVPGGGHALASHQKSAHSTDAVTWRVRLDQPLLQRHQAPIREKDARVRTVLPRTETAQKFVEIGPEG